MPETLFAINLTGDCATAVEALERAHQATIRFWSPIMTNLNGMTEVQKQTLTQYAADKSKLTGQTQAFIAQHVLRNQPTLEVVLTYQRPASAPGDWTPISEALADIDSRAQQAEEDAAEVKRLKALAEMEAAPETVTAENQ